MSTPEPAVRRLLAAGLGGLVALVTFATFGEALSYGFVEWDDDRTLLLHDAWRGLDAAHLRWMFGTFHLGHYQPLAWLSFAIDEHFFGLDPRAFHRTSLLLHALSSGLMFAWSARLLRGSGQSRRGVLLGALLAALWFGVHPLRVESVVWVTERRDVLCGVFFLAALIAYDASVRRGQLAVRPGWMAGAVLCMLLSMLSKAWAVGLPAVLLLLDAWVYQRWVGPRAGWRLAAQKLPFVVVSLAGLVLAYGAQSGVPLGALSLAEHSLSARVAQAAHGLLFYPLRTLVPLSLSPLYELRGDLAWSEPTHLLRIAFVLTLSALLLRHRRRLPFFAATWFGYVLIVAPVLGFLQSGPQLVADRYSYLATLGFPLLAAAGWLTLWRRGGSVRGVAGLVALASVAAAIVLTRAQTRVWASTESLWRRVLENDPDSWVANTNYGRLLLAEGRAEDALPFLVQAIRTRPRGEDAWLHRAAAELERGRPDEAKRCLEAAAKVSPHPGLPLLRLGQIHVREGRPLDALECFQRATRDPWYAAQGHLDAGYALRRLQREAEATAQFEAALRLDPSLDAAHQALQRR